MGPKARWLGVLDDSSSRIAALRELRPTAHIVHAVRVTNFFRELEQACERYGTGPSLIILDHDLGIGSFEDIDGNNGLDAAQQLADGSWRAWRCPVLVWSTNAEARPRMIAALREPHGEGSPPLGSIPFERLEQWLPWLRRHTVALFP